MKKWIIAALFLATAWTASAQMYGTFYGVHLFTYKSNLFNSDDLRADSFQAYSFTPGIAGQFEYGYLYENGFSVSGGIQFGTNNQKYKGSDGTYNYDLKATTKTSYLKIPLTFAMQAINDRKMKFIFSWGFYYSYNAGYSDYILYDFKDPTVKDLETRIDKDTYVSNLVGDTAKTSYAMDNRPFKRHGLGALGGVGFNYKIGDKTDLMVQVKGEFLITNAENNEEVTFTPTGSTAITEKPRLDRPFQNYAKYMFAPKTNHNRAGTHPFNFGISIGIRRYLFDF
jgi:hypothetical protein